ncbi:MAG TPA: alpha/beta fold hydrolase [Burkholderiaceae bacterium]|nr:alpha/beta fold hydrolase [Burkholderiaceae bacterium]
MKPVLLLIPGMLNTSSIWNRVAPLLQDDADIRIANVCTQTSISEMARDAWRLLENVPAQVPKLICGFSMGGYVAIEMTAGAKAHAINALALLDTSCRPEAPEGVATREKTIAALERNFEKTFTGIAQFGVHEKNRGNAALMDDILSIMRDVGVAAAVRQNRAIMARTDHRAALAQLRFPALVMCGRADQITPPALSEELAATIPGARLEWIEDAGHMTPLEQPARVAQLLRGLLQGDPK